MLSIFAAGIPCVLQYFEIFRSLSFSFASNGVIANFSWSGLRFDQFIFDLCHNRTEIISNLGFTDLRTTALYDCIGNAFQVVGLVVGGYVASHIKNSKIRLSASTRWVLTALRHSAYHRRKYRKCGLCSRSRRSRISANNQALAPSDSVLVGLFIMFRSNPHILTSQRFTNLQVDYHVV